LASNKWSRHHWEINKSSSRENKSLLSIILHHWDTILTVSFAFALLILRFINNKLIPESTISSLSITCMLLISVTLIKQRYWIYSFFSDIHAIRADAFFYDETGEGEFITNFNKDIWLLQETGRDIGEEYKQQLVQALQDGKNVKIILTSHLMLVSRFMSLRNESLSPEGIISRSDEFLSSIKAIASASNTHSLEIRYTPYPIDMTAILLDPVKDGSKAKGLIRLSGFRTEFHDKLRFSITKQASPHVFQYFYKQILSYYLFSFKAIVISARLDNRFPNVIEQLYQQHNECPYIYIGYLQEKKRPSVPQMDLLYISNQTRVPFVIASRSVNSSFNNHIPNSWGIDDKNVLQVFHELNQAYENGKIIIFDGRCLLHSDCNQLITLINEIINSRSTTIILTITPDDNQCYDKIVINARVKNLSVYKNSSLLSELEEEVSASIKISEILGVAK
jgi:hypothetical protein